MNDNGVCPDTDKLVGGSGTANVVPLTVATPVFTGHEYDVLEHVVVM